MPHSRPVDAGPTVRRLRELASCGVALGEVAAAAGRPEQVIAVVPELRLVSPATAAAVERADELIMGPLPGPGDVDEVAVERLVAGDPPARYSRADRLEAVRRLRRSGLSLRAVAARLRVSQRLACRDLASLGLTSGSR